MTGHEIGSTLHPLRFARSKCHVTMTLRRHVDGRQAARCDAAAPATSATSILAVVAVHPYASLRPAVIIFPVKTVHSWYTIFASFVLFSGGCSGCYWHTFLAKMRSLNCAHTRRRRGREEEEGLEIEGLRKDTRTHYPRPWPLRPFPSEPHRAVSSRRRQIQLPDDG